MAAGGLAVELEATHLQLPYDLSVPEASETAHSGRNDDCVVPPLTCRRQVQNAIALAPGFDQFPGNIAGDVERLSYGPSLCDEPRKFIRCREE
jgi:hypothetical protein